MIYIQRSYGDGCFVLCGCVGMHVCRSVYNNQVNDVKYTSIVWVLIILTLV